MLRNNLYYSLKPFIPQPWRRAVRRRMVQRQRELFREIWPIMPGSQIPPANWGGWPEGKRFAVVLTHDVESGAGLARCRELMQHEIDLGFRSSYNFVPEGSYCTPRKLRLDLAAQGFEVGVHDLRHNGRLYRSRAEFSRSAERINRYLSDWNAGGFRSGFMLHNLDWLHELDLEYDASTFDTDPFEPQPEGRHTIFPFWIPRPGADHESHGYVELPYTLPQDSTMFLLLRETTIDIWKRKIDWIAEHGGMVLVDTHPDYMAMEEGNDLRDAYPVQFYLQLLQYLQTRYEGQYWPALPREVARWIKPGASEKLNEPVRLNGHAPALAHSLRPLRSEKIWIDLDNTPHVPFFEPIIDELRARRFPVIITARDAFQVCELADQKGLTYLRVGRHHGKNAARKIAGLMHRSLLLAPAILKERPLLGVSHGSRAQILLANFLRIPSLLIEDYEYCRFPMTMRPSWVMAPSIIPDDMLPSRNGNVRKYEGIKEDVYAWKLVPDRGLLAQLGLTEEDVIVTVRPPATEAHYHNPQSEDLFEAFMRRAFETEQTRVILLPRNKKQGDGIRRRWRDKFEEGRVLIPQGALDGLNLLWNSDLVVSGGGTMNREAAALGVPVYSIFRGHVGAVDRKLSADGRLIMVQSVEEVESKIALRKRDRVPVTEATSRRTLHEIVDSIEEIAEFSRRLERSFS